MSSPKVTYSYADGLANTIRPTSVTYPDNTGGTRVLRYDYGTAGGQNDKLSRVAKVSSWDEEELSYDYLGLGTFVKSEMNVGFAWSLVTGDSSNPYASLDRFGRVLRNYWYNTGSLAALDDIRYTYDRASNRTTRENLVAKAQTTPQYYDELYGYDGSNRLSRMQRGQLASTTSITNLKFQQDWGLDPTGNWQAFSEDSDGSGTNDLVQARTANPVNEITDITNTVGTPWVQPGYDAAGNMTTIPQGNEPEEGFVGVYDAWNRLVKLTDEADNLVAEYAYDGLTRRVTMTADDEVRHYYYSASWQILEERVGSATTYDRQYVWGLRYIDNCVFRDNPLSVRRYVLQDANWNVTAIALGDAGATILERYSYSAYGVPTFLNADFTAKASSDYEWDVLYAGYKWDDESGMYQVRYRYLLPTLGCWGARDPIGYKGGDINTSRFARNAGVIYVDPNGLNISADMIKEENAVWSCRCGWIDFSHAGGKTDKVVVSGIAQSMWDTIVKENGVRSYGRNGFKVHAHISSGNWYNSFGVATASEDYFVASSLSQAQKESVFLTLWMDIETKFEETQRSSAFSEEDLPSDWIFVYRFLKGYTKTQIKTICDAKSIKESLEVLKTWKWGKDMNHIPSDIRPSCVTCSNWTWPAQFQTIPYPAKKGTEWDYWAILTVTYIGFSTIPSNPNQVAKEFGYDEIIAKYWEDGGR